MSGKLSGHFSRSFRETQSCGCCYTPDIRNIGAPLQIFGDRVKVDKEAREKQDWDGGDGSNKSGDLGRGVRQNVIPEKRKKSLRSQAAIPAARWRQRPPANQETGLPWPYRWTGQWRAGTGWPREAALSSSIQYCSTWWGRSPGEHGWLG